MTDPEKRFDAIIKNLKENEYKLTPQRLAVAKILSQSEGHPSVEQIYDKLMDQFPTISMATVYRNVMIMKSLGQVLELGFPDGSNRYDGKRPYPHPHVICIICRKIIDPDLDTLKNLEAEVAKETGFEIRTHRLDFFGVCEDCCKKQL